MNFPDIKNAKIGIIYIYYERMNETKNQTNLSFFIKYGLNEKNWQNMNLETLFVINGHQCEVMIPTKPNINVLKQDNCSDWEGWYDGIKFYENKYKNNIWNIFDYLCLINAGAFGPVFEENTNDHWLLPFYYKMRKDNAVLCSPCMSFLPDTNMSGTGPKVIPIFSLLRCSENIINLLTKTPITLSDQTSINPAANEYKNLNTVLGKKINKEDAVLSGEYGLSRILLQNNYNITSLLYDFHSNDKTMWNINNFVEPDRYNTFNGKCIPLNTIFIKTNWRWEGSYASLPVLYNECKQFFNKKLNIKTIFDNIDLTYNYSSLPINSIDNQSPWQTNPQWYTKEEYYNKFGFAEENILFNKPSKNFKGCLIYAHYDADNIVKDYIIETIKIFRYLGYDILFFTACKILTNVSFLPCNVFYTNNEGAGTDWRIWLYGCKYLINHGLIYDYVFILNDSIILPINGISNFEKTIINMRSSSDFWGHWESDEVEWHIIGTPIEFKYQMIHDIIPFIENNLTKCSNKIDFIFKMEVKFAKYLVDKGYKWNTVIKKNILNNNVCCPVFNPINLDRWLNNPETFAIKWKYSLSYLNENNYSKELNYLTKYLYYGKYGIISDGEKMGAFMSSSDF
uniref:Uncharacterized protein n=1 Tax=viral metagenome TaxID=1070528 RepID=A0A6C0KRS4_9ZZZZ